MHKLKQHILQQLILNQCLNYAKLKPKEIDGNLFTYHLRQLTDVGLVSKNSDGFYQLTPSGQIYADRLSLKTLTPRIQPRIVTLLAIRNLYGHWLMYRRLRQPLINLVGFPYGKVHVGETIAQAAARELSEKTGLIAQLEHRGDGYITIMQDQQITSQILFHLFYSSSVQGDLIAPTPVGEAFWADLEELNPQDINPSTPELIKQLATHPNDRFFVELNYQL